MYVLADKCSPLKSKARVEVLLAQPGFAGAFLKGSMQVLRVDSCTDGRIGCGFALAGLAGATLSLSDAAQA